MGHDRPYYIGTQMAIPQLSPHYTPGARVEQLSDDSSHYRLFIPAGSADSYRLAQLDDYNKLPRKNFPHHSLTLSLSARTSSDSIAGTWGFGLWNNPFGMSIGFGGNPWRLPALPNAVWFFGASEENYLSFKSGLDTASPTRPPVNGFIAQAFRSPRFHPLLIFAGLTLPFSRRATRRMMSRVIEEDGVQLWNKRGSSSNSTNKLVDSRGVSVDPTQWHHYRLEWNPKRVLFEVDNVPVFESTVSPNPPLGLVIWIDNQYAAFTPEGKIGMGILKNDEAWLEVKEIKISPE